ncbi:MAG TPA: hypothetical protein VNY06_04300 [Methylocella sp.]|jgi:hypothetical protein|nr:hypothetical protein [Methylocella sp.]
MDFACVQVLFADLQQGIIARSRTNPPEELASSAGVLAEVAKLLRLPIHFSLEAAGGVTTSVVGLVTALVPDFSTNPGQQAFGALQSLRHRPNTALNI